MGIEYNIYITSSKQFDGVINLELLAIEFLQPTIDFSQYDAIIFTSQNAIKACESISTDWREVDSYAIGEQTYAFTSQFSTKCNRDYFSENGRDFAKKLIPLFEGKRVLYPKPKESAHDLKEIFEDSTIQFDEVIVYESRCNKVDTKIENPIIIFTSPKTVRCFLKQFRWREEYIAISIGESTKSAIPKDAKSYLSEEQNMKSCIEKARELKRKFSSPKRT